MAKIARITEEELMKSKWWDYRLLTPDDATLAFILAYASRKRLYMDRLGLSMYMDLLKKFDIENPKTWHNWKMCENARKWCDERGIHYEHFWTWACEAHESGRWKSANMSILVGETIRSMAASKSEQYNKTFISLSKLQFFRSEGYVGCPLQTSYHESIISLVKNKYGINSVSVIRDMIDSGELSSKFFISRRVNARG